MWMMGYNNNEDAEFSMVDHSLNGRKLRTLMPRPMASPINISTATTTPCLNFIHGNDFFSQYHHLDQSKSREQLNVVPAAPVMVSSRWNPTPEQLRALEELYRRGTRTPSADQIQHITAQLRRFGKIEGKNVFYWFQNHKARERQKRRRQLESHTCLGDDHHHHHHHDLDTSSDKKELAASRTVFEADVQNKNLAPFTNCSSTLAEESVSIKQRAAEKAEIAVCKTHGWLQFEEGELQQRRNFMERNATWHNVNQFSCPPHPPPSSAPAATTYLINTHASTTVTTRTTIMDPMLIKTHDLSFFINNTPHQRKSGLIHLSSSNNNSSNSSIEDYDNNNYFVESNNQTTLQLFPLRSSGDDDDNNNNMKDEETEVSASAMNADLTPSLQFFEFLPLKN